MKIDEFQQGMELLYHAHKTTHQGKVNFIDDVTGRYITLTIHNNCNLLVYKEHFGNLQRIEYDDR